MDLLCLSCESGRGAAAPSKHPADPQVVDRFRVHPGFMAENDETPAGADDTVVDHAATAPESAPETAPDTAPAATPEPAAGFTSRVWSFRAMVAVALASLVIGGGIGSAIAAVSGDDESDDRVRIGRFDGGNGRGPGGFPGGREFDDQMPGLPGGGMREFRQEFGEGLDPEDLEQLKEMRREMREQMQEWRKELQEQRDDADDDAPEVTPSPSAS